MSFIRLAVRCTTRASITGKNSANSTLARHAWARRTRGNLLADIHFRHEIERPLPLRLRTRVRAVLRPRLVRRTPRPHRRSADALALHRLCASRRRLPAGKLAPRHAPGHARARRISATEVDRPADPGAPPAR